MTEPSDGPAETVQPTPAEIQDLVAAAIERNVIALRMHFDEQLAAMNEHLSDVRSEIHTVKHDVADYQQTDKMRGTLLEVVKGVLEDLRRDFAEMKLTATQRGLAFESLERVVNGLTTAVENLSSQTAKTVGMSVKLDALSVGNQLIIDLLTTGKTLTKFLKWVGGLAVALSAIGSAIAYVISIWPK